MKLIKSAIVYKTELPAATELAEKIEPLLFAELLETQFASTGFEVNRTTNELVTEFAGGYSFTIRRDEKVIPAEALAKAVAERVRELEEGLPKQLSRKEIQEVREAVAARLAVQAFSRTKLITCYYHTADQRLFVDTTSNDLASRCVALLLKALGTLVTTTIHISDLRHGLATRLKAHVASDAGDDDSFGKLRVGDAVELSKDGGSERFRLAGIDMRTSTELKEALENGCNVDAIRFEDGAMDLKLTKDFKIQSIHWDVDEVDAQVDEEVDDLVHVWKVEAAFQVAVLNGFVSAVVGMFDSEPATVAGD